LDGEDGLDRLRLHDYRHSYASTGVADNFGLPVLAKLLGHKNIATTSRYAHLAKGPLKIVADTISEKIATAMGEQTANAGTAKVISLSEKRTAK